MNVKDRITNRYISNNLLGMSMRSHTKVKSYNLSHDASEQIGNKRSSFVSILDYFRDYFNKILRRLMDFIYLN